jgi:hypothetical protein
LVIFGKHEECRTLGLHFMHAGSSLCAPNLFCHEGGKVPMRRLLQVAGSKLVAVAVAVAAAAHGTRIRSPDSSEIGTSTAAEASGCLSQPPAHLAGASGTPRTAMAGRHPRIQRDAACH